MRHVEDHAEVAHGLQEGFRHGGEAAGRARSGAVRVVAYPVVGEADDAEAVGVPVVYLLRPCDGVRALHAENHAYGEVVIVGGFLPRFHVIGETLRGVEYGNLVLRLQQLVVRKLPSTRGVGVLLRAVLPVRMAGLLDADGNLDQRRGDASLAHLRQGRHDAFVLPPEPATEVSRRAGLFNGQGQIALGIDSANRHRVIAVDNEGSGCHFVVASYRHRELQHSPENRGKGTT